MATPPHYGVINGFVLNPWPDGLRFLDAETGQMRRFNVPDGDRFEYGSCSPWQDDQGEYQVVGRWMQQQDGLAPNEHLYRSFGVARYAMPSGRILNRIALEHMPASHPCWFPDMTARVIYAGGDGRLYKLDFEATDRDGTGDNPAPHELVWRCPLPASQVAVRDPVWSGDPRLGGRLIASLQLWEGDGHADVVRGRLWWLALSPDGGSIVAAGPLTDPRLGSEHSALTEERFPNLAKTPDGRLALAFLSRSAFRDRWQLHLAPVSIESPGGEPVVNTETSWVVADEHLAALPPFSADGQWIYGIVSNGHGGELVRFATTPGEAEKPDVAKASPAG
jgi:hypothetical protein